MADLTKLGTTQCIYVLFESQDPALLMGRSLPRGTWISRPPSIEFTSRPLISPQILKHIYICITFTQLLFFQLSKSASGLLHGFALFPPFSSFRPEKYMVSEHEEIGVGDDIRNHPRKGTGAISFRYSARPWMTPLPLPSSRSIRTWNAHKLIP
jgi:hypothetical protein